MNDRSGDSHRQPYVQPKLTVVGSVRLMTHAAGMNNLANADGMVTGNTKTR